MNDKPLSLMQAGFSPFLLATITDYATVYTATKNFLKVVSQLKQQILPLFCDEGVTTAQLHSTRPELRFCAGSNPACGVSEIHDGEDL